MDPGGRGGHEKMKINPSLNVLVLAAKSGCITDSQLYFIIFMFYFCYEGWIRHLWHPASRCGVFRALDLELAARGGVSDLARPTTPTPLLSKNTVELLGFLLVGGMYKPFSPFPVRSADAPLRLAGGTFLRAADLCDVLRFRLLGGNCRPGGAL